ncbi:DUF2130 domain-containing protein [Mesorhizobium sp. M2A.F.Ca.ET.042.01.1.1]|uniref:DUF2130 domain-containing protein n=1 Tax=Mesorhizobium sp. M2A.F.Ca.ET.042.01.1.1 TaxID=2496745 RepID=UPI000FCC9687|nr:DUF2130 domain-containing protein [Mesorhizobium sp. M2A.F.Ca.ET.042.01.1.1]RUX27829.1 DUF2130 domain-containing protein [Mesorhizobium sp. M2A.F.Ca.ET.042.01.1.1]
MTFQPVSKTLHGDKIFSEPTITCPSCNTDIKLNESLAGPLIAATREEYEQRIAQTNAAIARREEELERQRQEVAAAKEGVESLVAETLRIERGHIAADEARKAKLLLLADLDERDRKVAELQETLKARDDKLEQAQKQQAEFLTKQRELEDERRELALTIERRVQEGLDAVRAKARSDAEDGLKMKIVEKEEQIAGMQRQIEELKRRAEQGSQQLQGEALELELEALISSRFPVDVIEPVAKGEFGGDVLQRVVGPAGQPCGAILWESKRTKNWSQGWLTKLRTDQRAAKADIALLISEALPPGIETFDLVDGVYLAHPKCAIPIAVLLRQSLIELSNSRLVQVGQASKMELVYGYLTGPRFRQRIEAIVEKFSDMQDDLARERKATIRLWAKREAQIQGVIESTVGMYGDLQGIAGKVMQEIESLEVLAVSGPLSEID